MRAVSLFAGIGGFDLAMWRAGIHVTASAEIDKECRKILGRHFPLTTHLDDVRKVTAEYLTLCAVDIVTAGWPCQGNSVAGLRQGMADPRSGLWSEVARVLAETQPRWFVGENVPGLLSVNDGRDFEHVVKTLVQLGYGVAWRVLDAQGFGVPQRRRRVFIVGCLGDPGRAAEVLFEPESVHGDFAPGSKAWARAAGTTAVSATGRRARGDFDCCHYPADGYSGTCGEPDDPTATLTARNVRVDRPLVVSTLQGGGKRGYRVDAESAAGGHLIPVVARAITAHDAKATGDDGTTTNLVCVTGDVTHTLTSEGADASEDGAGRGTPIVNWRTGVRRLMPVECERLQGFPDGWTDGQSDSARYRQLGNAVAVPVVQWVMERIAAADSVAIEERMAA